MSSDYFESAVSVVDRPLQLTEEQISFWRKEDPVLDISGKVIRGGMWEHQRAWWSRSEFIKLMVGGYGSGKTSVGCKRLISLALQNAPAPVAAVCPTFPLARHTVIATLIEMLDGKARLYGRAFTWRYNKSTHEFRIWFRGRQGLIIVYSGDDPLSLRGPNLAAAYIDEPFIQKKEVFEQMIARVRHPDAVHREINLTGTPEQLNWGYDLCMGEMREQIKSLSQGAADVAVIHASTRANKALEEGYVKRLEGALTAKAVDAYVDGKFVNLAEGQVYYGFDPVLNVVDLPLPKNERGESIAEVCGGMDFNVNPMSAIVFWRAGAHMHVVAEYELPNADTEFMCQQLREDWPDIKVIYPDATGSARKTSAPGGKTDFWYIRQAGLEVRAHHENPKRKDRYNAVNGKLRPKTGPVTLTISPRCKKLIKYLSLYTYEKMNEQKSMSHLLDAFGYPVEFEFPVNKAALGIFKLRGT